MISVVVVSHDSGPDLERCFESVARYPAPGRPLELILVDNASSDGWPRRVAALFPALRLVALPENVGFGAGVNRGAALARGELVLLLNPDARLAEGSLEILAVRLEREPTLGLLAPRLVYPDGRLQNVWTPGLGLVAEAVQLLRNRLEGRSFNHDGLVRLLRRLLGPGWLTAACLLVRKRAFDAVGGFDEGFFLYFEDADLCRRLHRAGWELAVEPRARAVHALERGLRGGRVELEYRRSQLGYYTRHRPLWEQMALRRHLLACYRWRREPDATSRAVVELVEEWQPGGGALTRDPAY